MVKNIFGTQNALIGPIDLLFGGVCFLLSAIFRKTVANEMLGLDFSAYGSTAVGTILFIITHSFLNLKYSLIAGVVGMMVGGFLLAKLIPDGQSSGEGEYDTGGNYEE